LTSRDIFQLYNSGGIISHTDNQNITRERWGL